MRFNTEESADFATLDEAVAWVFEQQARMLEVIEVRISNSRRGIKDLFTKDYRPFHVFVKGTIVAEEYGE